MVMVRDDHVSVSIVAGAKPIRQTGYAQDCGFICMQALYICYKQENQLEGRQLFTPSVKLVYTLSQAQWYRLSDCSKCISSPHSPSSNG